MNDQISIALVSADCESAIRGIKDIREMLRKAFAAARKHWMVLDPDQQLKGALSAVLKTLPDDDSDRARLVAEIELMSKFSVWLAAVKAGVAGDPPTVPDGFDRIGVIGLWHESAP